MAQETFKQNVNVTIFETAKHYEVVKTWANMDSVKYQVIGTNFATKEEAQLWADGCLAGELAATGQAWHGYFVRGIGD